MAEPESPVNNPMPDGVEPGEPSGRSSGATFEGGDGGSPSSSSSDSDFDDTEASDELNIETLEKAVSENPLNYNAHVEYIHLLRKLGHIKRLREARESMNEYFPLSPKMWQEWAKDEISLSTSPGSATEIEKLYERGVQEYLSVPLWSDYIDFIQEHDQLVSQCSSAGISRMRNLFERALTAAGLHVVEGNKIWNAYREYEQAIFLTIDENDIEEKEKQVQRIRSVFQRHLSIPLVDLRSTLMAYKIWENEQGSSEDSTSKESDGIPSKVICAYQKAIEMYIARTLYEDQLLDKDASEIDRLQHFMNYIKFEESSGDPARVQALFERAVSEYPVTGDLWVAYTDYLDRNLKVANVLRNVYFRATRNCTWVGHLWVNYLLALERMRASEEELSTVFEKSIQYSFSSFKEYMDLFLTRVDGLRRKFSAGLKGDGLSFDLIRATFMRASDFLDPQKVSTDDLLILHSYWARLEAKVSGDLVAARGVWESLLKKSGSILEFWKGYITMEIEMGNINEARAIYKRCFSKKFLGAGSEDICYSWLKFEREYGTLDDYDLAVKKVTPRLQELVMFTTKSQPANSSPTPTQKDGFITKNVGKKRKMNKPTNFEKSSAKKRKGSVDKPVEATYYNEDAGVDKRTSKTSLEVSSTGRVDDRVQEEPNPIETKPKIFRDQCTAFVSNLNLQTTEEHLRDFFSGCGVTEVRLLKDKFTGNPRGIAYVDFLDDGHLTAAISKNKQRLLGNRLSIARSDPKQSKKRESSSVSSHGRGRRPQSLTGHNEVAGSLSKPGKADRKLEDSDVQPRAKLTFAVPRAVVRPLGWTSRPPMKTQEVPEAPKSNDEFRDMLLKK